MYVNDLFVINETAEVEGISHLFSCSLGLEDTVLITLVTKLCLPVMPGIFWITVLRIRPS